MKKTTAQSLTITESLADAKLSDAQQAFKQLVNTIEQQRARLAAWQQMVERYQQKYRGEFEPLLRQFDQQQTQLVQLFNQAYDNQQLRSNDKKKLSRMILALAADLLPKSDSSEIAQIVRMHRHADEPDMAVPEDRSGTEGPEEPTTILELEPWEHAARLRSQQKQQRQASRKSGKLREQAVRQHERVQDASRSLRAVYRQLASALHPDREQDELERQRKTALMQRVNVAYGQQDLLQLLTLQLEIEQIDHTQIEAQNALQLQHYHFILTAQLAELHQEIQDIQAAFGVHANRHAAQTPDSILRKLQRHIQQLRADVQHLNYQLAGFKHSENLIAWIKDQR